MASTQNHVLIKDIHDDVVILKDGSMAVVVETSAVNFGLLSEGEQLAIISSFAGLLNSLSFAIEVVIRSKRLDISNYLASLSVAQAKQTNPLLAQMISHYSAFIRETVRDNEVLDKQFYIVIPLSYLEIGLIKNAQTHFKKAMTVLLPRRDHIIRQLARTGLRAKQLNSEELIKLYYDIYNESPEVSRPSRTEAEADQTRGVEAIQGTEQTTKAVPVAPSPQPQPRPAPLPQQPAIMPQPAPQTSYRPPLPQSVYSQPGPQPVRPQTLPAQAANQPAYRPASALHQPVAPSQSAPLKTPQPPRRNPFVVEELPDDYGTV